MEKPGENAKFADFNKWVDMHNNQYDKYTIVDKEGLLDGKSVVEIAKELNMSRSYVSQMVNGNVCVMGETVAKLLVICDKEFDPKFCSYYVDEKNINMLEERCDFADISSYTTYLDQMILYISRRKGQHATDSYSLDTIGGYECGVKKLDYHDITTNIAKFPYLDFKRFWLYNMIDVIVQVCLEAQTGDLKYVFNNVIEMNTPYQKIFRQTVYLAAKGADFYKNHEGVIMGENVNKFGRFFIFTHFVSP